MIIENESGEEDVVTLEDVDCKLSSVAEVATYEQTYQVTLTDKDSQKISRKMVDSEQLKDYRVVIKEAGLQAAEEAGIYELAEEHMEEILIDLFSEFEGYEVIFA